MFNKLQCIRKTIQNFNKKKRIFLWKKSDNQILTDLLIHRTNKKLMNSQFSFQTPRRSLIINLNLYYKKNPFSPLIRCLQKLKNFDFFVWQSLFWVHIWFSDFSTAVLVLAKSASFKFSGAEHAHFKYTQSVLESLNNSCKTRSVGL